MKILILILVIILLCANIGFYLYEVLIKHIPPTENLLRTIGILCVGLSTIFKLYKPRKRNSLKFYELQYSDILDKAFIDQKRPYKKLLRAIRLYNEDRITKAIKCFKRLYPKCEKAKDFYAVYLFTALCFTDIGLYDIAEDIYQKMKYKNIADSVVYSNLGSVQRNAGKLEDAIRSFEYALSLDRTNANAYNNLAQVYFKNYELDSAAEYALKALNVNAKMHQASALLTIIYAMKDDRENYDKYFHIAVSSGRDSKELQESIQYFMNTEDFFIKDEQDV